MGEDNTDGLLSSAYVDFCSSLQKAKLALNFGAAVVAQKCNTSNLFFPHFIFL